MPLFHEASRIYSQIEVDFMRRCYALASIVLEETNHAYSGRDLASTILLLYDSGLRDYNYIVELSALLSRKKFAGRHPQSSDAASSNASPIPVVDNT
ncbi:hypothetical protein [Ochrobactrum sp. RH2CCR150]|uniref:hypothetical protein n=1 Tax=Ochrobactrum sp. RH2CCR150 TaxID=2587044 RepID=UPI0015FAE7A8|nr:hypothetical protein [Ochrobactrum sp. RH2CCR150]